MIDYIDVRNGIDGYKQEVCPSCGDERWFKHLSRERWPADQWNCQECGTYLEQTLEYPCPECGTRMMQEGNIFVCHVCDAFVEFDRDGLIDRMTERHEAAGYAYGRFEECPVCGERSILNTPDGDRSCDECDEFYAGRFMNQWFCYAIWKRDPDKIRVNTP